MAENSINGEMIRGHIDTIILLSLVDGDKDSNEIREAIENRSDNKFSVKQGTFYSAMQRLENQGYIKSFRSSASDGIRRKYFNLTDKGRGFLNKNKQDWIESKEIIDTLIETPSAQPAEPVKTPPQQDEFDDLKDLVSGVDEFNIEETESDDYFDQLGQEALDSLNSELNKSDDVKQTQEIIGENVEEAGENADFEQPYSEAVSDIKYEFEIEEDPIATDNGDEMVQFGFDLEEIEPVNEEPAPQEPEVVEEKTVIEEPSPVVKEEKPVKKEEDDYLRVEDGQPTNRREYKSILTKLFPKDEPVRTHTEDTENTHTEYYADTTASENATVTEADEISSKKQATNGDITDFSDLYAMANREGFKLRTSSNVKARDESGILYNKLRFHASALLFILVAAEMLIFGLAFQRFLLWPVGVTIATVLAVAVFPITMLIIYLRGRDNTVTEAPSIKNSVEVALIVMFQIMIIILCVALFASIDFNSAADVVSYIVLPVVLSIDIPVYFFIKYLLLNTGNYVVNIEK